MRVNGHRMHYIDEGVGDPVLLLHGNPTWSFLYRKFIPRIVAAGLRVIAPDHIGFGLSDRPAREHDFSLENHIANLAEFIRRLGLQRLTVVCQDWGGPTGLACAVLNPAAVKGIVVMNTWAWPEPTAFHSAIFPWRMMHAPIVGPYLCADCICRSCTARDFSQKPCRPTGSQCRTTTAGCSRACSRVSFRCDPMTVQPPPCAGSNNRCAT